MVVTADPRRPGHAYAAWFDRDPALGLPLDGTLLFARTTDAASSWSAPVTIDAAPPNGLDLSGQVLVLRDGSLLAVFARLEILGDGSFVNRLMTSRSRNLGRTWRAPHVVASEQIQPFVDPDRSRAVQPGHELLLGSYRPGRHPLRRVGPRQLADVRDRGARLLVRRRPHVDAAPGRSPVSGRSRSSPPSPSMATGPSASCGTTTVATGLVTTRPRPTSGSLRRSTRAGRGGTGTSPGRSTSARRRAVVSVSTRACPPWAAAGSGGLHRDGAAGEERPQRHLLRPDRPAPLTPTRPFATGWSSRAGGGGRRPLDPPGSDARRGSASCRRRACTARAPRRSRPARSSRWRAHGRGAVVPAQRRFRELQRPAARRPGRGPSPPRRAVERHHRAGGQCRGRRRARGSARQSVCGGRRGLVVHRGDGRLHLVRTDRRGGQRRRRAGRCPRRSSRGPSGRGPARPAGRGRRPGRAGRSPGVGEQHQREQPGDLAVVGQRGVQLPGQPDRLRGQLGPVQRRPPELAV